MAAAWLRTGRGRASCVISGPWTRSRSSAAGGRRAGSWSQARGGAGRGPLVVQAGKCWGAEGGRAGRELLVHGGGDDDQEIGGCAFLGRAATLGGGVGPSQNVTRSGGGPASRRRRGAAQDGRRGKGASRCRGRRGRGSRCRGPRGRVTPVPRDRNSRTADSREIRASGVARGSWNGGGWPRPPVPVAPSPSRRTVSAPTVANTDRRRRTRRPSSPPGTPRPRTPPARRSAPADPRQELPRPAPGGTRQRASSNSRTPGRNS
ncbi:hypothetical protein SALBM311S_05400 [Streptomyces alboniger]